MRNAVLSDRRSSVSGGTVGLSTPAPAARTCHGIAPGSQLVADPLSLTGTINMADDSSASNKNMRNAFCA